MRDDNVSAPTASTLISRLMQGIVLAGLCWFMPQASLADETIGGAIANLAGSGLVLRLDVAVCGAPSSIEVATTPAAGGSGQCTIALQAQCCSDVLQSPPTIVVNGDGSFTCTGICGVPISNIITASTSSALQAVPATQTVAPASGDTSYVFPTALPDLYNYTVSVDTQPNSPAQVCGVANATGTTQINNVTDANVSCTPIFYKVTVNAGVNGSATPLSQFVAAGSDGTVTLAPSAGYRASAVGCGGSLSPDGLTYTTAALVADCTVNVTFLAAPPSAAPLVPAPMLREVALLFLGFAVSVLATISRRRRR